MYICLSHIPYFENPYLLLMKNSYQTKIVFLDGDTLGDTSLDPIRQRGDLTVYPRTRQDQVIERIADCDVVIVNKVLIRKQEIDAAPNLKLICVAATGVNNVDVAYASEKGIPVRNVAGYSTESVVQVTFMHLLNLFGQGNYFDQRIKNGTYTQEGLFTDLSRSFREINGKTIGIIGMGTIGQRVAAIATAFGMRVCYYSTSGTSHCKTYPSVSLDELLSQSDVISIHAPLNATTKGLLTLEHLQKMKPTAFLINMGRGGIVVEKDLAQALMNGHLAGAATDVFEQEPIPADHPYLQVGEKLLLTPHIGWASVEARDLLVKKLADNISLDK